MVIHVSRKREPIARVDSDRQLFGCHLERDRAPKGRVELAWKQPEIYRK